VANSSRFFQVESDLRSSARNRQILLIPAYKEATSNLAQTSFNLYTLVPQQLLLRYELAECLSNSQLVRYFTKHMPNDLLPTDPIERQFSCAETGSFVQQRPSRFLPALNIYRFDASHYNFHLLSDLSLLIRRAKLSI